ncbi:MAG: response regulator transcription factor, partial [Verrucomicrobiota bacterium]
MNAKNQITVLLVEDHKLVRIGLRTVLEDTARIRIVGEATTVKEGVAAALRFRPNVAVIDIRLPDGTGFDVCRKIKATLPESKALLLTSFIDDHLVLEAISAGADGYLLKSEEQDIAAAIETVAAGGAVLDPAVTRRMLNQGREKNPVTAIVPPLALLSKQELRVIELVAG